MRRTLSGLLLSSALLFGAGCIGTIVDAAAPQSQQGDGQGNGDGTGGGQGNGDGTGGGQGNGDGTGGGGQATQVAFFPDIQQDLDGKSCTLVGCHDVEPGGLTVLILKKDPQGADRQANYDSFAALANDGPNSKVLTTGLPTSTHTGAPYFPGGEEDELFKKWLGWIENDHPSGL